MTPAIRQLEKAKKPYTLHEYEHNVLSESYGWEAVEKLGVAESRVFKTLVVSSSDDALFVAIVPVAHQLSMKSMAKALNTKRVSMAAKERVQRSTGYVLGGVSPLGQKKPLKTLVDDSARPHQTIYVSTGKRGLEIELSPSDLIKLTNGNYADLVS